ncbi:MAG: conjugal transfer protein TraG N-terminal domain-containing protein, partial [Exilibacterium sp.]
MIADNADGNGILASAQNLAEQGLAVYGLARESISLAAYLRIFLEGAPMLQALILMGLYALLPFFILMSRYRLSIFIIGALILFIVKFWTVLWFFAWWVDKNLIKAFYPDPGDLTTFFNIDMTIKRVILNFLTGMMYLVFPLLFSTYLAFAGIHAARDLNGASSGPCSATTSASCSRSGSCRRRWTICAAAMCSARATRSGASSP